MDTTTCYSRYARSWHELGWLGRHSRLRRGVLEGSKPLVCGETVGVVVDQNWLERPCWTLEAVWQVLSLTQLALVRHPGLD